MPLYTPTLAPEVTGGGEDSPAVSRLLEYLKAELELIAQAMASPDFIELTKLTVEPTKKYDGLTVYADGTSWNPGSGQGVYTYYAGAWNKLG